MKRRDEILSAAAGVFAQHGFRGSTTRRIAEAAGVNEVTLFRQFGSKESLLLEAIALASGDHGSAIRLPESPGALRQELIAWAIAHHISIRAMSGIIRTCLAEWEQRPDLAP